MFTRIKLLITAVTISLMSNIVTAQTIPVAPGGMPNAFHTTTICWNGFAYVGFLDSILVYNPSQGTCLSTKRLVRISGITADPSICDNLTMRDGPWKAVDGTFSIWVSNVLYDKNGIYGVLGNTNECL